MNLRSGGTSIWLGELLLQIVQVFIEALRENVRHRHQFDGAALDGQRVGRGAGAAPAAADQGHLDQFAARSVDGGMATLAKAETAANLPVVSMNLRRVVEG